MPRTRAQRRATDGLFVLGDDALRACHGVHHERNGEDGLVEVKCVAERVVALSCTDVTHDDGP